MSAPDAAPADGPSGEAPGRLLFRYVTGEEWQEYRAVMAVFAGTFFSEFTPDEVEARLVARGISIEGPVVADRLESLRRWGNLTVSSSTGTPRSLADYYKRRNRYLITRAGQEVHELVEGVLTRVDEVRDISTGRLRALLDALRALLDADVATADPVHLADLVRAVFDPHQTFTSEITQFFAAINQWQSRYDLSPEEFRFFAEVLVGYVSDRLEEIERVSRPIGAILGSLRAQVPVIVERANRGLATRVEEVGLQGAVTVSRTPGSSIQDWVHLAGWFVAEGSRPARMDQLRRDAVSAVRALTVNLSRLSRAGAGNASRRGDLIRLARLVHGVTTEDPARLVTAAFGLHPPNHFGALAGDAEDPVGPGTSWWDAPPAMVPVALRERGNVGHRGSASPIADRTAEQRQLRHRRRQELDALRRIDAELLAQPIGAGPPVSPGALARLEQLVGKTLTAMPIRAVRFELVEGMLACTVERSASGDTVVRSHHGTLTLRNLVIDLRAAGPSAVAPAAVAGFDATAGFAFGAPSELGLARLPAVGDDDPARASEDDR